MTTRLHPLARQFDAEWERLRYDREALRRARGWGVVGGPVHSLDEVLHSTGYRRRGGPAAERALRRLVEAAADDPLAAQVVVHRLLPGVLTVAGRRRRQGAGDDTYAEVLSALWIAIREFNPRRRPANLAAALLADADYRAFRLHWRRRTVVIHAAELAEQLVAPWRPDPAGELADLIARAAAAEVVDADDVALLAELTHDPSPAEAARRLRLNERTVRNRRDRAVVKLRLAASMPAAS